MSAERTPGLIPTKSTRTGGTMQSRNSGSTPTAARRDESPATRLLQSPVDEGGAHSRCDGASVQRVGGRDGGPRKIAHRRSGKIELRLENDRVRLDVADRLTDVPQRARPDLPIVVHFATEVGWVVQAGVDAPETVRDRGGVRHRIPVGDARRIRRRRDDAADGDRPVVAKPFADSAGFFGGENEVLREMDGVAVLVEDHFRVFRIVDPALAETQFILVG